MLLESRITSNRRTATTVSSRARIFRSEAPELRGLSYSPPSSAGHFLLSAKVPSPCLARSDSSATNMDVKASGVALQFCAKLLFLVDRQCCSRVRSFSLTLHEEILLVPFHLTGVQAEQHNSLPKPHALVRLAQF